MLQRRGIDRGLFRPAVHLANLSRPSGNFTGVTYSEATLGSKRLELLLDALPGTRRFTVIWSRAFPENVAIFDAIRQAAQARGVEVFLARTISCYLDAEAEKMDRFRFR
jgi:ABC-type uncharacterized transport system substrate-binding protein